MPGRGVVGLLKMDGFELKLDREAKEEVRDRRKVGACERMAAIIVLLRPQAKAVRRKVEVGALKFHSDFALLSICHLCIALSTDTYMKAASSLSNAPIAAWHRAASARSA